MPLTNYSNAAKVFGKNVSQIRNGKDNNETSGKIIFAQIINAKGRDDRWLLANR